MADWREASDPECPECGEALEPSAMVCPHCEASLLSDAQAGLLDERIAETLDATDRDAPRWAVALTGLSIGAAVAPMVLYAVVVLVEVPSVAVATAVLLVGWLGPAAALSRLATPSAVLTRGLTLIVIGVAVVVLAVGYEVVLADGPSVVSEQTALVSLALAVPAALAALIARRAIQRADRRAREEPAPLHERADASEDEPGD